MDPGHIALSNPGLRNFLFCFFKQLAILPAICIVSQYLALLWCVDLSKGENYHFITNTPGKYDLYFILCQLSRTVSVRRSYKDATKYSLEI